MDELESGAKAVPELNTELSIDASYTFERTESGVYLAVSYEQGTGMPLIPELVAYDIIRRGIAEQSLIVLLTRLKKKDHLIKLADAQEEKRADADLAVKLSRDEMTAMMMLFPPVAGGDELSPEAALTRLRDKWHIAYGLDEQAAYQAVADKKYHTLIKVARGREPVRGQDGRVTIMFKTAHSHAPRILEDGSADYKNLDIFESALENDLLAVISPPEDGIEGMTVMGKTLSAPKGKPAKAPKGKNTRLSEDGLKLFASKSGRVDYTAGLIEVSDVLRIADDVDMGVGNIDFPGDIEIKGNVISGLTIVATGNIEILGVVEAASIIAGKNIVLKTGIQGMDKGILQAGGNITARFIERTQAQAKGSLYSDYIAHSTVSALGQVALGGRHAKIISSIIRSGKEVIARHVGVHTLIEIGVSPEMRARLASLEDKYAQGGAQLEKIDGIMGTMPAESPDGNPLRQKLMLAREQLDRERNECAEEIGTLRTILAERSGGKIHVTGLIEQDVKLIIDSIQYTVKSNTEFTTFRYQEGEILFGPCEKPAK
jgi:uncharacterized protein (DUF342 family)